jgi:hypothetical protein
VPAPMSTTEPVGEVHLARRRKETTGSAWNQLTSSVAFAA